MQTFIPPFDKLKEVLDAQVFLSQSDQELLFLSLLCGGHVLIVGPPGVAKTRISRIFASLLSLDFKRIQFTADLLPSDILGGEIFHPKSQEFMIKKGPIFGNLILIDELNRAPAKVQSALLEAMEERQVTLGSETFQLPEPFSVLATMNPYDGVGTYTLPSATYDRFLCSIHIGYPSQQEEFAILTQALLVKDSNTVCNVIQKASILQFQKEVGNIFVDTKILQYITRLSEYIRVQHREHLHSGLSLRSTLGLVKMSQARAFLYGKSYVSPQDVTSSMYATWEHRLIVTYEAQVAGLTAHSIIERALKEISPTIINDSMLVAHI